MYSLTRTRLAGATNILLMERCQGEQACAQQFAREVNIKTKICSSSFHLELMSACSRFKALH